MSTRTVAACLTPPGTAAIATLAVRGPRAWDLVRELWRADPRAARELPAEPTLQQPVLGRLGDEAADEVVIAVKETDPVPLVEIHSHGGREVVRLLLDNLRARGVEIVSWPEWEGQTSDPLRAAASVALAQARTVRTAAILLDQYQGAFARAVEALRDAGRRGAWAEAERLLEDLARQAPLGRHLTTPWRVVVAGAPNVGKSSLVNALAGYARCVVSPTPGTTRDVVSVVIALDGWPVELLDTAGQREDAVGLEQAGIALARDTVAAADLRLWVLDASAPPVWPTAPPEAFRFVINKVDLLPAWDLGAAPSGVRVSAQTGEGLAELSATLVLWLVPGAPAPGVAVPFTPVLCDAVEQAWGDWRAGDKGAVERLGARVLNAARG
jgi:tRNA modification GTPase